VISGETATVQQSRYVLAPGSALEVKGWRKDLSRTALAQSKPMAETPDKELEHIAQPRHEGRHEDADKALAEFRKRYPGYGIPDAMLQRVERR